MPNLNWIKKETEKWVSADIITPLQAELILSLYPEDRGNRLITVLLVLGAVLLGAGVILFFASNWQQMPAWLKVSIVMAALVSFHLASFATNQNYPKLSATLTLLACIMFGAGIWLIAQIYHINSHFPNGILLWLLGTLPAAYLLRNKLSLALGALLFSAWAAAETTLSIPVLAGTMILSAAVIYLVYQMESPFALVAALVGLIIFITKQMFLLMQQSYGFYHQELYLMAYVLLLLGPLLVNLAGFSFNKRRHFRQIYQFIGIFITGLSLFLLAVFFTSMQIRPPVNQSLLLAFYCTFAVTGFYLYFRRDKKIKTIVRENYAWLAVYALLLTVTLIPVNTPALTIAVHVFIFAWALSLIMTGYRSQESLQFTLGLIAFNLYIVFEYFNLGWQALPKSIFFIVGGLILIVSGFFMEHQRRKVIQSWQEKRGA